MKVIIWYLLKRIKGTDEDKPLVSPYRVPENLGSQAECQEFIDTTMASVAEDELAATALYGKLDLDGARQFKDAAQVGRGVCSQVEDLSKALSA